MMSMSGMSLQCMLVYLTYMMSMPGMSLYGFSRSSMVGRCITDISLCIDQVISGSGIVFCNRSSYIETLLALFDF